MRLDTVHDRRLPGHAQRRSTGSTRRRSSPDDLRAPRLHPGIRGRPARLPRARLRPCRFRRRVPRLGFPRGRCALGPARPPSGSAARGDAHAGRTATRRRCHDRAGDLRRRRSGTSAPTPVRNAFSYRSYSWLVDLDDLPRLPGWLAPARPLPRRGPLRPAPGRPDPLRAGSTPSSPRTASTSGGGRVTDARQRAGARLRVQPAHACTGATTPTAPCAAWSPRCTTPTASGTATCCGPTAAAGPRRTRSSTSRRSSPSTAATGCGCPSPATLSLTVSLHRTAARPFTATCGARGARHAAVRSCAAACASRGPPPRCRARIRCQGILVACAVCPSRPRPHEPPEGGPVRGPVTDMDRRRRQYADSVSPARIRAPTTGSGRGLADVADGTAASRRQIAGSLFRRAVRRPRRAASSPPTARPGGGTPASTRPPRMTCARPGRVLPAARRERPDRLRRVVHGRRLGRRRPAGLLTVLADGSSTLVRRRAAAAARTVCGAPHTPHQERNTADRRRRNIRRHYDLSNELFAAFLDETMTYSSALFPTDVAGDRRRRDLAAGPAPQDRPAARPGRRRARAPGCWRSAPAGANWPSARPERGARVRS